MIATQILTLLSSEGIFMYLILNQFSDFSKDARASFSTSLSFGNRCVGFLAVVAAKTHLRCLTPTRSSSWPDLQGLE